MWVPSTLSFFLCFVFVKTDFHYVAQAYHKLLATSCLSLASLMWANIQQTSVFVYYIYISMFGLCFIYYFVCDVCKGGCLSTMCVEAEENSQKAISSLCPPNLHPQPCTANAFYKVNHFLFLYCFSNQDYTKDVKEGYLLEFYTLACL